MTIVKLEETLMSTDAPKLKNKEQIAIADQARITVTLEAGPPRFAHVVVLAPDGIFKNGTLIKQDEQTIISLLSAESFLALGEVQILGEVDSNDTHNDVFKEHSNA